MTTSTKLACALAVAAVASAAVTAVMTTRATRTSLALARHAISRPYDADLLAGLVVDALAEAVRPGRQRPRGRRRPPDGQRPALVLVRGPGGYV